MHFIPLVLWSFQTLYFYAFIFLMKKQLSVQSFPYFILFMNFSELNISNPFTLTLYLVLWKNENYCHRMGFVLNSFILLFFTWVNGNQRENILSVSQNHLSHAWDDFKKFKLSTLSSIDSNIWYKYSKNGPPPTRGLRTHLEFLKNDDILNFRKQSLDPCNYDHDYSIYWASVRLFRISIHRFYTCKPCREMLTNYVI